MHFEDFIVCYFKNAPWLVEDLRKVRQDLSGQNKQTLIKKLPDLFEQELARLKIEANKILWRWAALGGATTAIPLPLIDIWIDQSTAEGLKKALIRLYGGTMLPDENSEKMGQDIKKPLLRGPKAIAFNASLRFLQNRMKGRLAKFVPFVGSGIAAGQQVYFTRQLGNVWINSLEAIWRETFLKDLAVQKST
jgi:hypothetical protein